MINPTTMLSPATILAKAFTISLWVFIRREAGIFAPGRRISLVEEMFMASPKRVTKRITRGKEEKSAARLV